MPRTITQIVISSTGLFLGAVINANIFGELAIILASLDKKAQRFEVKLNRMNTIMLQLYLPFELQ